MSTVRIRTLPFGPGNYGGIMQAYALCNQLTDLGYEVSMDQRPAAGRAHDIISQLKAARHFFTKGGWKDSAPVRAVVNARLEEFVSENLIFATEQGLAAPVATIVGSDQVWRKEYTGTDWGSYFLDDTKAGIRLSYAASFGTDSLDSFTIDELSTVSTLLRGFDGVSVRESSGAELCRTPLGVEAAQHVDPTMLLTRKHYCELADLDVTTRFDGVFSYFLDPNHTKSRLLSRVTDALGTPSYTLGYQPIRRPSDLMTRQDRLVKPRPETWLKAFRDAKFVVTDSFHGCVFAVIFGKDFLVVGNSSRGMARFDSLLTEFGLMDRLVHDDIDVQNLKPIDWDAVGLKIVSERVRSIEYLSRTIGRRE